MNMAVFVNGRSLVAKSADGKSVAAFPDVCLSPPSPPAGPVPLPYPNTAFAKDLTKGSKTVQSHSREIAKKNVSYFRRSTGDEAATKSFGMSVVTHQIQGQVYFNSWSMNVKIEGMNVPRHLDITTHNHASMPGNTPAWPYLDGQDLASSSDDPCKTEKEKKKEKCGNASTKAERCANSECRAAMKCELQPYTKTKKKGCCKGQTPHHLVEVHCFTQVNSRKAKERLPGFDGYDDAKAPCVCCDTSSRYYGDHGSLHAIQNSFELMHMDPSGPRSQMGGKNNKWTYKEAKKAAFLAQQETFPLAGCSEKCISAQLDAYHGQPGVGVTDSTILRADRSPLNDEQKAVGETVLRAIKKKSS